MDTMTEFTQIDKKKRFKTKALSFQTTHNTHKGVART